ncbi:MAG: helix-turn-helix transcriptional regulator [Synergistaceae bacterium]|nr:helix-turn-helix transcriptional regulator [Synergistaceae bacterium]MBQ7170052.1 helix-turn-helix transcriptional regulator [Synergistaceae bacterium]
MTDKNTVCPLKYLANTFGGKWKLPIICILADMSPKRYSAIKRRLGNITGIMLSQSLKELEAAGLVSRKQYNEVPPHVEYSLTERGKGAIPMLTAAAQWAVNEMKNDGFSPNCTECQAQV